MNSGAPKIFLKRGKAGPSIGRHPWLFAGAIERIDGVAENGSAAAVYGDDGRFVGWGIYNSRSQIRLRLYSFSESEGLDDVYFAKLIKQAVDLRLKELKLDRKDQACRMVFSEGDGLSGLTVDQFGSYLSVQITSFSMFQKKNLIAKVLAEALQPKGVFFRVDRAMSEKEGFEPEEGVLIGEMPDGPLEIVENELKFEVDIRSGQKTGFYCDQRDNRKAVAALARSRRVLDLCCYTGAFSLTALKAGAVEAIGVDSSSGAVQQAKRNAEINSLKNIQFHESDIFEWMKSYSGDRFGMVVLDPPKLATSRDSKVRALRTYFRMNEEALKLVEPGGIFVSCSCSGGVSREELISTVSAVGRRARRSLQLLELRGAASDHPVSLACPETNYLKCAIVRVL